MPDTTDLKMTTRAVLEAMRDVPEETTLSEQWVGLTALLALLMCDIELESIEGMLKESVKTAKDISDVLLTQYLED